MAPRTRKLSALLATAGSCLTLATGCGNAPDVIPPAARLQAAASGAIERVPPRDARPRPTQLVLALPQLGRLRARCGRTSSRYLVSYTPGQRSESVRASVGGMTVVSNAQRHVLLSFSTVREKVGREFVRRTPTITLRLDSNHEPFEVLAHVRLRLAEAQDGTTRCVAPTLRTRLTTRYH